MKQITYSSLYKYINHLFFKFNFITAMAKTKIDDLSNSGNFPFCPFLLHFNKYTPNYPASLITVTHVY